MQVLGILGSPRRGGNTELLLDQALAGAKSTGARTEKVILNELKFVPCQNCGGCDRTGICITDDEMQKIYEKIERAQGVIIASPIFFGSLSAQTKAMVDRFQCRWVAKEVLGKGLEKTKAGLLILVEGSHQEKFFRNAESIVKNLFAVLDIEFSGNLYCPGVDRGVRILEYPDCLKRAFQLGQGLVT